MGWCKTTNQIIYVFLCSWFSHLRNHPLYVFCSFSSVTGNKCTPPKSNTLIPNNDGPYLEHIYIYIYIFAFEHGYVQGINPLDFRVCNPREEWKKPLVPGTSALPTP